MSKYDMLADDQIDQLIANAYQRGWRACLAEVVTRFIEFQGSAPDFIRSVPTKAEEGKDASHPQ